MASEQRAPSHRRAIRRRLLPACLALAALVPGSRGAVAVPQLSTDTPQATAGYYRLSWTADAAEVVIEQRTPATGVARTLYTGPDRATLISGQADGTRVYRAGALGADGTVTAWSEPVTVRVTHHPLGRALAFFALGALVFLATLLLIARGAGRQM